MGKIIATVIVLVGTVLLREWGRYCRDIFGEE